MNDVRRALLFWPAFTSALIILIALISPLEDGTFESISKRITKNWSSDANRVGDTEKSKADIHDSKVAAQLPADSGLAYAPISLALTEPETVEQPVRAERAIDIHDNADVFRDSFGPSQPTRSNEQVPSVNDVLANETRRFGTKTIERLNQEMFSNERKLVTSQPESNQSDKLNSGTLLLDRIPFEARPTASRVDLANPLERPAHQQRVHQPHDPSSEIVFASPRVELSATPRTNGQPSTIRQSVLPKSVRSLAKMQPQIEIAEPADSVVEEVSPRTRQTKVPTESIVKPTVSGNPGTWPLTPRLIEQLAQMDEQLSSNNSYSRSIRDWTTSVQTRLSNLNSLPRLGDPAAGDLIEQLSGLANSGLQHAELLENRRVQIAYLQTAHALNRRMAVWKPVWSVVSQQHPAHSRSLQNQGEDQVSFIVDSIRRELVATGDEDGWANFLMLQELTEAAAIENANVRSATAQRVLSRIQWHGLTPIHRQWLNRESIDQLVTALQPWSQSPIDYAALLNQVERKESDAIDLADIDIASATQTLRYSDNPAATQVALAIDTHYRNANIRTAISQEMLRRLIPTVEPTTVPVRTNMLGTRVKGISHVNSQLDLQLRPAAGSWALLLQTQGSVHTHSVGHKGQAQVQTRGRSNFAAATPIAITPNSVDVSDSSIDVQGSTRLRNVNSQYDSWPLLGSLARTIITAKYNERSGLTSRIANRRMRTQIIDGIDERLEAKVAKSTSRLNDVIMGPLNSLKLQPKVIDMQTTDDRLIARYRLAGDWQIGASTPRPRAPSDSLLSVQINQSALNNTLVQIVPQGKPTTLQSAFDNTMTIFGRESMPLPADIPSDVQIQFTKTRPITIEMEEGILWVTMRVVELSRDKGGQLNRFIVRAGYRPEIEGLRVSLVRDGHLRISGPGMAMRQRLPIRAIFNKVFSPNHKIPVTNESFAGAESLADCAISQIEIRDGWMALAVSPARPEQIAVGRSNVK